MTSFGFHQHTMAVIICTEIRDLRSGHMVTGETFRTHTNSMCKHTYLTLSTCEESQRLYPVQNCHQLNFWIQFFTYQFLVSPLTSTELIKFYFFLLQALTNYCPVVQTYAVLSALNTLFCWHWQYARSSDINIPWEMLNVWRALPLRCSVTVG